MASDQNEKIFEVDEDVLASLRHYRERGDGAELRLLLSGFHAADMADLLQHLDDDERLHILGLLDDEIVGEVMLHLPDEQREKFLAELAPQRISDIVEELSTDDAADIVSELSEKVAEEVLHNLELSDQEATEEIRDLLRYDDNTAGGRMTTDYVAVARGETVSASIERIREFVQETELDVHVLYVVDQEYHLVGVVRLQDLVLRPPTAVVGSFMLTDLITVAPDEDQGTIAQVMQRYELITVPVIDDHGILLGVVTFDDIAAIIDDETSEDMLYLAGVTNDESPTTSPLLSIRRRLPWLIINLGTAFLASMVVSNFEGTIHKITALAALMPIVAGMGGNAAVQAITVMVRSMALGEMGSEMRRRAIIKEVTVGLLNGLVMGLIAGTVVWLLWENMHLGILISAAMLVNLLMAGAAGALIPLLLRRFNFDPALSSGPIVTTVTDVCGFFTFLGLATLTLNWLLGE